MKRFIALLMLVLSLQVAFTVKAECPVRVYLDYHYMLGLSYHVGGENLTRKVVEMHGNSLRLSALYKFSRRISAGAGIGLDRYVVPSANTMPVFAVLHYHPIDKVKDAYLYTNVGYAPISNEDFNSGFLWDLGVGYTKMFHSHFGLNFQLGYNMKNFDDFPHYQVVYDQAKDATLIYADGKESTMLHSITFGFGLVF